MSAVALPEEPLAPKATLARASGDRWELYRLLAEPVRLRLLALAAEEELTIGELAELVGEGQPNVSRHVAPLRQAGLIVVRKEGTRALVRLAEGIAGDPVVADALSEGRALCRADGSLRRVHEVVRARDAQSRAFFAREKESRDDDELHTFPSELGAYLSAIAPLIPHRQLAVDAGTGDGGLLEVAARIFERVVAFDREGAQLARAQARIDARGFTNVELVEGEVESARVQRIVRAHGGADVVFAARLLHHAPKPAATIAALATLAKPGGALVLVDYARHDDESMREQADLWLGFDEGELRRFARDAGLESTSIQSIRFGTGKRGRSAPDSHLPWQVMVAKKPDEDHEQKKPSKRIPARRRT